MEKKKVEQTINRVSITGVLVKNGLQVRNMGEEKENISGDLVLRTADGSEHAINFYANRYKKDQSGAFTSEESGLFKGYETIVNEYISLEKDSENADVITVGECNLSDNDFLNKGDGTIVSNNKIKAKFANRLTEEQKAVTPQVATFEVSGIITKIEPEVFKAVPTGNQVIMLDVMGYNGTIIPVKLLVPQTLVTGFNNAGFYATGAAKFSGNIINNLVVETVVEKQAFGADLTKEVRKTIKRNEITGGSPLGTLDQLKITQDEYVAAQSKRRLKLEEIKNKDGGNTNQPQQGFTQAPQQNTAPSPFAQSASPFASPFGNQ